jgi:ADP-ribosylglycohydrolase/protein-tyrosine phosphatase
MDRLRSFLSAGVTCFIDLTQAQEIPSYEALLPFATPSGRRVEYLRQPIADHGVPEERAVMERILALVDGALAAGHIVYVHCRAGIGRSATVAGCWLAAQRGDAALALEELQQLWKQAAQSARWLRIPETEAQEQFVLQWLDGRTAAARRPVAYGAAASSRADRLRGAWLGLAVGDAMGLARASERVGPIPYSQPTALALCLADSLLDKGRCDARDQIERYLRWQREGLRSAGGEPGQPTPDVTKALGTYLWRGLPMAGSHDPKDRAASSLSRVVAAATYSAREPAVAIALAGECSRTTHQSPLVIDACRYFAAVLLDAFRGRSVAQVLDAMPEPGPDCWGKKPPKREIVAMVKNGAKGRVGVLKRDTAGDVLEALGNARAVVSVATEFEAAVRVACDAGNEPSLDGALAGALFGALHGVAAIPRERIAAVQGIAQVQDIVDRLAARDERPDR